MVLVYLGIIVLFLIQPNTKEKYTSKLIFCIIAAIFCVAVSMSRDLYGGDLINYRSRYINLPYQRYSWIFDAWRYGDLKDGGFYMFSKIFADMKISAEVYFGIIAASFSSAFAFFTYKHSKEPFLSLIILLTFYLQFTFTGLRQAMALACGYIAYYFVCERKPKAFLITVLIATCFHSSALCMLPIYWLSKRKTSWNQIFIISVAFLVAVIAPDLFRSMIDFLAWNDYLAGYTERKETLSWSGYIIQMVIWVFCMVFRNGTSLTDDERQIQIDGLLNCMLVGLCIQGFSSTVAESFRISFYYSICSVAVIPNVIMNQRSNDNKNAMRFCVLVVLMAYMLWKQAYFKL